ncbi:exo-beta-N-acetylmuramidase NamZ family protein [Aequorivita ciconiae]|uniref:exo-beta-N-acetylmuramidase NamZ family protein n=1 Tax=Aequorivita ciconiae TaxID=2494375 RepID=UPI00396B3836
MGAEQFHLYAELLKGRNVGVVANQTSFLGKENQHLVDFLILKKVSVKKVFAPEHGFRGTADAGEHVKDGVDSKTGVPLISLYGSNKKPSLEQLKGIDVMVFDIQDVGARFYTYISTLHYVMEACAELGIPVIVLDRPNPNGHYIDGPILEKEHQSFVGMHPVPVVHGMTIGEYAKMINGEGWLNNKIECQLTVIKMENYTHQTPYSLPIKPSPNLPNDKSINLYPSLCFFEGTFINAGRGTDMQFQVFGAPSLPASKYPFTYTPQPNEGSKDPKFKGQLCHGKDLRNEPRLSNINLEWLIESYNASGRKKDFFNSFFVKLAGTKQLQQQIEKGMSAEAIRDSWKGGLEKFEKVREKYLSYP